MKKHVISKTSKTLAISFFLLALPLARAQMTHPELISNESSPMKSGHSSNDKRILLSLETHLTSHQSAAKSLTDSIATNDSVPQNSNDLTLHSQPARVLNDGTDSEADAIGKVTARVNPFEKSGTFSEEKDQTSVKSEDTLTQITLKTPIKSDPKQIKLQIVENKKTFKKIIIEKSRHNNLPVANTNHNLVSVKQDSSKIATGKSPSINTTTDKKIITAVNMATSDRKTLIATDQPLIDSKSGSTSKVPLPQSKGRLLAIGSASWYGIPFHGRRTANGEVYDMHALTAAHKNMPLGSTVKVTNLSNNRSVVVRINDRGPYIGARILDLSYGAAKALGFTHQGLTKVKIESHTKPIK